MKGVFNVSFSVFSVVRSVQQIPWLSCQFTDEHVSNNSEGHIETQLIPREAMVQFGLKGDAPVNPHAITFLITGELLSKTRIGAGKNYIHDFLCCFSFQTGPAAVH